MCLQVFPAEGWLLNSVNSSTQWTSQTHGTFLASALMTSWIVCWWGHGSWHWNVWITGEIIVERLWEWITEDWWREMRMKATFCLNGLVFFYIFKNKTNTWIEAIPQHIHDLNPNQSENRVSKNVIFALNSSLFIFEAYKNLSVLLETPKEPVSTYSERFHPYFVPH